MAYGDIISNIHTNKSQYRESNGVETVHAAVVLRDSNTKGSPAINHLSNHLNLDKLTAVKASNRAGLFVGSAGDVLVLLSGDSAPIVKGTADTNTANKLVDSTAKFTQEGGGVQLRDVAVNTTDNTAGFISVIDSDTSLQIADIDNAASDVFPDGNETYEIYRAVLFQNVAAGSFLPIQVDRVFALGTTSTDIIAIY